MELQGAFTRTFRARRARAVHKEAILEARTSERIATRNSHDAKRESQMSCLHRTPPVENAGRSPEGGPPDRGVTDWQGDVTGGQRTRRGPSRRGKLTGLCPSPRYSSHHRIIFRPWNNTPR